MKYNSGLFQLLFITLTIIPIGYDSVVFAKVIVRFERGNIATAKSDKARSHMIGQVVTNHQLSLIIQNTSSGGQTEDVDTWSQKKQHENTHYSVMMFLVTA